MGSELAALTDVRFKLLGLVPAVSLAIWGVLISNFDELQQLATALLATVVVCVLGFLVTLGIFIYDRRNQEFYNDLISRGRRVEEKLGVHIAIFRGRFDYEEPLSFWGGIGWGPIVASVLLMSC